MSNELRHYGATIMEGEKVRLRALQESDLLPLAQWWNDPEWMILQNARVAPAPDSATMDMFQEGV